MKIKVKITTQENIDFLGCKANDVIDIELEDYVATVVASEIGNVPLNACKAQAIAVRSFAVARGVLNGKVISDNSSTAQSYRAKRNNYVNCVTAAQATEGQVLTYEGKVISAVYCDSNGGRTYSAEEVWGGKREYLIAREDPWTRAIGAKKSGHGVGLSQKGAIYAAKQGVDFEDILSFYYPNTSIIKIKEDKSADYSRKVLEEIRTRVQLARDILQRGLE